MASPGMRAPVLWQPVHQVLWEQPVSGAAGGLEARPLPAGSPGVPSKVVWPKAVAAEAGTCRRAFNIAHLQQSKT